MYRYARAQAVPAVLLFVLALLVPARLAAAEAERPDALDPSTVQAETARRFSLIPERKSLGLFLAAQAVVVVDMGQTLAIRSHPEIEETNPIFGREPSDGRVYAIFGTHLLVNTLAYWLLPDRWANRVSMLNLVVGIPAIAHNASVGLSMRF